MADMRDLAEGVVKKELHVFYVLDTSGSMTGAPIAALNDAMRDTVNELAEISKTSADAAFKLAVMEYNSNCRWVTMGDNGLEEMEDFVWSELQANGMTYLGAALTELNGQLSRNAMMKSTTGNKIPVIIFMSDGYPNDNWEQPLSDLKANKWYNAAIKIAFALGDDADAGVLAQVVGSPEAVIKTSNLSAFKSMIRIASVTASLAASTSRTTTAGVTGSDVVEQTLGGNPNKDPNGTIVIDDDFEDVDIDIYDDTPIDLDGLDDFS